MLPCNIIVTAEQRSFKEALETVFMTRKKEEVTIANYM